MDSSSAGRHVTGERQEDVVQSRAEQGGGIELDADRMQLRGDGRGQTGLASIGAVTCRCSWSICGSCTAPPATGPQQPDRSRGQGQLDALAADLPLELAAVPGR